MGIIGKLFGSNPSSEDRELMNLTNQRLAMYGYLLGTNGELRSCPGVVVKASLTKQDTVDVYDADNETRLIGSISTRTAKITYASK